MKILITTDPEIAVPPKYYGGAERIAYNLIKGFQKCGVEVVLIANKDSSVKVNKHYAWPGESSVGMKNNALNAFKLLRVIKEENPDVIYCFSRIVYIYPAAFATRKTFYKRYGRFVSAKSTGLANMLLRDRIQYIALARHMISHLEGQQNKWNVIPNCVDTGAFYDDPNIKKEHLMFLGRIEHIKGTKEAIEIAIRTNQKLLIAGNIPDDQQEYFNQYVKPYLNHPLINYVGQVDDVKKRYYLQRAKVLLFPINLKVEAFGIVMIESLACGTPVIGRNIAAVPEVIVNGHNGYVCDSVEEMCEAVNRIDEISRVKVRQDAEKKYSIEAVIQAHLKLFNH